MNPSYPCPPATSESRPAFPRPERGLLRLVLQRVLLIGSLSLLSAPAAPAQLYTESQTLFGEPNPSEYFGYFVATSGDTLVVSTASNKRIHVFARNDTGWSLQQKIAANYSNFSNGYVAIDGDTLVAGNEIYVRSGGVWTLQQALPFNGDPRPALQGDTLVIGEPYTNPVPPSNGDGSVHVYVRDGVTWTRQAILPPDTTGLRENMGATVRIDGDTLIAGTVAGPGGAYVFVRDGATWTRQARLPNPSGSGWMTVGLEGNTAVVSDPANNVIHVYDRTGTSWNRTATIPLPATGLNYFGDELALNGGILAASADSMFYLYSRTSSGWLLAETLRRDRNYFGALDLGGHGKVFVLSNPFDNTQTDAGGIVEVFSTPPPPAPGGGWRDADVGAPGLTGGSADNGGTITVRGSGADIWGQADQFHFRTESLTGNGAIIARVNSAGSGNPWSKVGLMFREDLAPASREVMAFVTPGSHRGVQFRSDTADNSISQDAGWGGTPAWLMLARSGDTFAGYRSDDGNSWTPIGSTTAFLPRTVHVGLAVSSHDNTALNTGTFADVEIVPTEPPAGGPNPPSNLSGNLAGNINVRLQWTDNSTDETGFIIERALGNANGAYYPVTTVGASATEYTDWGLAANTTYSYRVRSDRNNNSSTPSNDFTVTTLSQPSGTLSGQDIGQVVFPGSYTTANGVMTINASGSDIWGRTDSFFFIHLEISGDFDFRARVTALGDTNPWAKAGVMIRESLDPQSPNVCTLLTAENAAGMQARDAFGADTTFTPGPWVRAPYWTRLVRRGDTFESLTSEDGATWTSIATRTVPMAATVHAGIAVTSHASAAKTQATVSSLVFNAEPL